MKHLLRFVSERQVISPQIPKISTVLDDMVYPDVMSCDNGYMSGGNLDAVDETGIDAYIATGKGENKGATSSAAGDQEITKSAFAYDASRDCFVCPVGNILELKSSAVDGKKTYQAKSDDCSGCSSRHRCCTSKNGAPRMITTDDKEPLRQAMIEKMKKESSQKIYKRRKTIVEPVFGQIKKVMGFRGFSLRGVLKVSGEFSLVCATHNIKKIVNSIRGGVVIYNKGNLIPMTA